jgi:hypothetical protein
VESKVAKRQQMSRGGSLVSPKPFGRRRLCRGTSSLRSPCAVGELTGSEVGVERKVGPEYQQIGVPRLG